MVVPSQIKGSSSFAEGELPLAAKVLLSSDMTHSLGQQEGQRAQTMNYMLKMKTEPLTPTLLTP